MHPPVPEPMSNLPKFQCVNPDCLENIDWSQIDAVFICPHCGMKIELPKHDLALLALYKKGS
jgi:hypothetical protein